MPESPEALYARVLEQADPHGRLTSPTAPAGPADPSDPIDLTAEASFPWEVVDGALVPKVLTPPTSGEEPRLDAESGDCPQCADPGDAVRLWESWNFHLLRPAQPSGFPMALWLNANEHLDFTQLNDDLAAEYGRLQVRLSRIIGNLEHVGRVHLNSRGDGAEHLHTRVYARPAGFAEIRGAIAFAWDRILPPVDRATWEADCATVARKLALHDGHALV